MGPDVVGPDAVGHDVTGAISLGQDVSGAQRSGAGRWESFHLPGDEPALPRLHREKFDEDFK